MTSDRRERLAALRRKFRAIKTHRAGHGVFLRRGSSGVRRMLSNERELEQRLEKEGFLIVDPEADSFAMIRRAVANAAIVCGVEGSAFAHAILGAADGAVLVTLQPPYRFNNVWKDFTDALGMRYALLVGSGGVESFEISPSALLRTIDLARGAA